MNSLNRIYLMGHLGKKPELKIAKTGKAYCLLSVATHRNWKDNEEVRQERTDWHSVFVFGTLATHCCNYLQKGSGVLVEGSLAQWNAEETSETSKRLSKTSINAHSVHFINRVLDNSESARNHNAVAHLASS